MKSLYLTWQDSVSRNWYPVGRLISNGTAYLFHYTKGAQASENFKPFGAMHELEKVYFSPDIFPLFSNRIMQKNRPEYKDLLKWLDLSDSQADPLLLLEKTAGKRETDSLALFAEPQQSKDGGYEISFFVNGIKHLPREAINRIDALTTGEELYLMKDLQNPFDAFSIVLRTGEPIVVLGFCPRYLNADFNWLLDNVSLNRLKATVKKVNPEAPIQLRLLCELKSVWPDGFKPCSGKEYQPISDKTEDVIRKNLPE